MSERANCPDCGCTVTSTGEGYSECDSEGCGGIYVHPTPVIMPDGSRIPPEEPVLTAVGATIEDMVNERAEHLCKASAITKRLIGLRDILCKATTEEACNPPD